LTTLRSNILVQSQPIMAPDLETRILGEQKL
jgi:hypothetical protein